MSNDLKLKVTLTGDGRQLSGTLKDAQESVRQFGGDAQSSAARADTAFGKTRAGVESISSQLSAARNQLLAFLGASAGLSGIGSLIRMADDYGQMAARIEMATTSVEEFRLVQERLQETAGGTYRRLEEAQELYIQTADALRNLGYATEQQLDITDSLSYLFVTNATSADRAQSSINAFRRSMMTGKVSADDWNSMLMATPTLVNAIAESTGKTTAEIRELGVTGKLALADLTEGLRLSRDENQRLSDGMALTVDDALVRLRGNFTTYIGELNASSGATATLAEGIATVAENIDTLATVTLIAGGAALSRYGLSVAATTAATVKDTLAKRAAAIEEVKLAQAQAASTATALTLAQAQAAAGGGHLRATRAAEAHTASLQRLSVAQQNYIPRATAATVATNAWRGSLALLGGPAGIAIIGSITAITYAIQRQRAQAQETVDLLSRLQAKVASEQAERNSPDGLQRRLEAERQALLKLEQGIQSTRTSMEQLRSLMNSGTLPQETLVGIAQNYQRLQASLAAADGQMEQHRAEIEALESALEQLGVQTGQLNAFGQTAQQSDAISKITEGLVDQIHQLQLGERAYLDYQLAQQNATAGQRAQALAAFDASKALKEKIKADEEAAAKAATHATTVKDFADGVLDSLDPLREIEQQMELVWAAFDAGHLDSDQVAAYVEQLKKKLKELDDVKVDPLKNAGKGMGEMAAGINSIAGAMQGMYEEGDRGYRNMAVAMQAANVIAAVGAVLTQGMGDPYTAFARMAAMAASVAALGYSVGSIGAAAPDDAARRQAQQGTGTVLGDAGAKSESIAAAVEINASATQQLVGINRDQLRALQAMQAGISGAAVRVAQGSMGVSYDYGGGRTAIATPKGIFDHGDMAMDGINGFVQRIGTTLSENLGKMNLVSLLDPLSRGLVNGVAGLVGKMSDAGVLGDPISKMYTKGVSKVLGGESKVTDRGVELIGGTMAEMMEETLVRGYETTRHRKYRWRDWSESTGYFDFEVDPNDPGRADPGVQFREVFEKLADSVYEGAIALGLAGDEVAASINNFVIETQKISLKDLTAEEQAAEIEAVFSSIFDNLAGTAVEFLQNPGFQKAGEGLAETLARVATNVQVTEEAVFRLGFAAENINPEQFARLSEYLIEASGGLEQFIGAMSSFVDKFAPESHKLDLLAADMERSLAKVGLSVPATRDEMWQLMQSLDATTQAGADQIATLLRVGDTADAYYKMLEQAGMRLQALLGADQSDALTGYLGQLADWSASELSRIEQDYRERIALAEQQLRIGRELRQYVEQLRISELSPYDPGEKLQLATEQFAALLVRAEQGDMEAARLLQSSAQAYLQNADSYYGRSDPYLTIFEEVTRSLDRLGLDIMGGLDDNSIERLNQQMLSEQQRIRDYTQQELQWAVRQYDALTSIEQLLELLPGSLADQLQGIINKPAPTPAAPDRDGFLLAQIEQMYTHHLGRDADVEGAQYWVSIARDHGLDAVDWNIRNSEEYKKIHGSHRTGLPRVPFDGYVAELHKDERVLTAGEAQGYNQFDSGAIVAKLDQLCAENAALRQEVAQLRAERKSDASKAEVQRERQLRAALKTPEVI